MDLRNLGEFSDFAAVWKKYPEGGKEGDYLTVGTEIYRWNKYRRTWHDGSTDAESFARALLSFDGDVSIKNNLSVGGSLLANIPVFSMDWKQVYNDAVNGEHIADVSINGVVIPVYSPKLASGGGGSAGAVRWQDLKGTRPGVSYFSNDASYLTKSVADGLYAPIGGGGDTTDHSLFMTKKEFAEYFDKFTVGDDWVIRAKKTLCSVGDVVAFGVADIGGGGGGGVSSFVDLTEVVGAGAPSSATPYWGWNGSGYGWIAGDGKGSGGGGGEVPADVLTASNYAAVLGGVYAPIAHVGNTDVHVTAGDKNNWNTAYGWGNHAAAGYVTLGTEQTISGRKTFSNSDGIVIGGLVLKADGDRLTVTNSVSGKVAHVCASGDVVAYGIADIGGDKQQIDLLTSWTGEYDSGFALGAGLGVDLNTRVKALEDAGGGGGGASSWAELTGKPTTLSGYGLLTEVQGMIPKNYLTASDIQGKFVELTGEQTVAGVKTWSDNALFNGKVGIGERNNSTAYALQVAGNVRIFNSSTSGVVINGEGGIDLWHATPYINFKASNGDEKLELLNYIADGYSVARFEAENKTSALSLGGDAKVYWDAQNSAWRFEGNIIASGDIVAYGAAGLAEIGSLEVTSVKAEEGRFTKMAYFGDMLVADGMMMPSSDLVIYAGSGTAAKFISGATVINNLKIGGDDAQIISSVSHQKTSGVDYICFQVNGTNYRVKAETY